MNVRSLQPTFFDYLVAAPWRPNQQTCLQGKKVHGVLTEVVRSVALPSIARGTMQSPLHPHFLPQKCLTNENNEEKDTQAKVGVHQGRATRLLVRRLAGIPPIEASITLRCHLSFIHASRFPTHYKPETTQKHPCTPPPRPDDMPFGMLPGPTFSNCVRAAHRRLQCNEKTRSFIYVARVLHIANQKSKHASECRPPFRSGDAPFPASPGLAFG